MTTPWHPTDTSVAAAIGRRLQPHSKTYLLGLDPHWCPPTGDTYQLVTLTSPDEMTCLGCGETFVGKYCHRCGYREDGAVKEEFPPAVRTLDYLKPGEYKL